MVQPLISVVAGSASKASRERHLSGWRCHLCGASSGIQHTAVKGILQRKTPLGFDSRHFASAQNVSGHAPVFRIALPQSLGFYVAANVQSQRFVRSRTLGADRGLNSVEEQRAIGTLGVDSAQ